MNKYLLIFALLFLSNSTNAQEVQWVSFEEAIALNKENPKPILVDIYTDWCGWCKKMDKDTYANPVIAAYINKNYYAVKLDGEGSAPITYKEYTFKLNTERRPKYHELSAMLMNGKLSYPTTVFMNKKEELLTRIPGYLNPRKMEMVLTYFIKEERETKSWGEFSKKFKSKLKE